MKKMLVLGIGNAQVDLLNYLEGKYFVLACANSPGGRGYELCDRFEAIDITDRAGVLEFARKEGADFIYSVGSEAAMPAISWVSRELGLPHFVSYETAITCADKNLLRKRLQGVPGSVNYQVLRDPADPLELEFPVIIKPADCQGQRGVSLVRGWREAEKAIQNALQYSAGGAAVAEEYIDGPEISVNAFMRGGFLEAAVLSDRISWPGYPGGLIRMHHMPCTISGKARENTLKLVREVVSELGIYSGPAYFQIKISQDKPRLIEVTPRLDGCHLWRIIRHAAGIDLLDLSVRLLTGRAHEGSHSATVTDLAARESWTLEFFCAPPGSLFAPEDYRVHPGSVHVEYYYGKGERVREINGYMEKCGYQIYAQEPAHDAPGEKND